MIVEPRLLVVDNRDLDVPEEAVSPDHSRGRLASASRPVSIRLLSRSDTALISSSSSKSASSSFSSNSSSALNWTRFGVDARIFGDE